MIPVKYLSKIGVYEVEFQGAKVKASVVDDEAVFDAKINELWKSVRNQKCPVVGDDFNLDTGKKFAELFILCGMNHCLIIKIDKFYSTPDSLNRFFNDKTVCFVGNGIPDMFRNFEQIFQNSYWVYKVNGKRLSLTISIDGIVEASVLAGKVLKKPKLCTCGLAELVKEVATALPSSCQPLDSKVKVEKANLPELKCPNWKAVVFSDEEIKYAIYDAYSCCSIGYNMLEFVDAAN